MPRTFGLAVVEMKGTSRQLFFLARIGVRSSCGEVAFEMKHVGRLPCTPESSPVAFVQILATVFGCAIFFVVASRDSCCGCVGFSFLVTTLFGFCHCCSGNRICPAKVIANVFAQSAQLRRMCKDNGM